LARLDLAQGVELPEIRQPAGVEQIAEQVVAGEAGQLLIVAGLQLGLGVLDCTLQVFEIVGRDAAAAGGDLGKRACHDR
jgi:hypothetical protein